MDSQEGVLLREEVGLKNILSGNEGATSTVKEVVSLDELTLSYLSFDPDNKSYQWQVTWNKEQGVFAGIRWEGKVGSEKFTKTILIPTSP